MKTGDRVTLNSTYPKGFEPDSGFPKRTGTIVKGDREYSMPLVAFDGLTHGHGKDGSGWYVEERFLSLVGAEEPKAKKASVPSVADDLRLSPQAKTVLRHIKKHPHISNMQAQVIYGISRLAACVYEIRKAGYSVKAEYKRDDQGHKYTNYALA